MIFPRFDHYLTGTAVPVSSLHGNESCGIGEFLDLIPFGSLCKKCGIELVQILPINDTGTQRSPYSAVSAFALHPVYIRLQNLPGNEIIESEIEQFKHRFQHKDRVDFEEVLKQKLVLCRRIFEEHIEEIENDGGLGEWITKNPWVKPYSVYKHLKQANGERSWVEWKNSRTMSSPEADTYWQQHRKELLFHPWVQMHLERQLREVTETLGSINIALKGDLPILMIEDSVDVWFHQNYFHLDKRAGAPPDMFSDDGQNWGFPIYNWEQLRKDDYNWWKRRLRQAAKFYHAFRIDHVLGFFRIWTVPEYEESASMGFYIPYKYISEAVLESSGFSRERIAWLSEAHIHGDEIIAALGDKTEVMPYLRQIGEEELYLFTKQIRGTADIDKLPVSVAAKREMKEWKKNRALIPVESGTYFNAWHLPRTRGYQSLDDHEKRELHQIIDGHRRQSEKVWEKTGKELLSVVQNETDMLVCAEDLGAVPDCVPKVLGELEMLSLKIGFWTRRYDTPGQPFIHVDQYPFRSVATLSVHDSFVFREWWEEVSTDEERISFCEALGITDISKQSYTPKTAEKLIAGFFSSASYVCVLQIQDFFAIDSSLRKQKDAERINIPGTVDEKNWTYRIPKPVEELLQNDLFCSVLRKLTSLRRNRPLPPNSP